MNTIIFQVTIRHADQPSYLADPDLYNEQMVWVATEEDAIALVAPFEGNPYFEFTIDRIEAMSLTQAETGVNNWLALIDRTNER